MVSSELEDYNIKDYNLNMKISSKDIELIKEKAKSHQLPYQTLITDILHLYARGYICPL